jgi:nitrogen fixation/metabolism regulation signal transduction histidine kinase
MTNREAALGLLTTGNMRERLAAARQLQTTASRLDVGVLTAAARRERVPRIRVVLMDTIARLGSKSDVVTASTDLSTAARETAADTLRNTTQMVVHEIRKLLPPLTHAAEREIPVFSTSRTREYISRLDQLIDAVDRLGKAATPPVITDFDLAALIQAVAITEANGSDVSIEQIGPSPCLVRADHELLRLAIGNAIRNAVEATESVPDPNGNSVVVSWDISDTEYWIVVLDRGIGLPEGGDRAFEIGVTSKSKHDGIGLAIARQAIESLDGSIELSPREPGGTACEIAWPVLPL